MSLISVLYFLLVYYTVEAAGKITEENPEQWFEVLRWQKLLPEWFTLKLIMYLKVDSIVALV